MKKNQCVRSNYVCAWSIHNSILAAAALCGGYEKCHTSIFHIDIHNAIRSAGNDVLYHGTGGGVLFISKSRLKSFTRKISFFLCLKAVRETWKNNALCASATSLHFLWRMLNFFVISVLGCIFGGVVSFPPYATVRTIWNLAEFTFQCKCFSAWLIYAQLL